MKPYHCCNPLCHASFTNMPDLLQHAHMSGRCAAYSDLRKATNMIQTAAIEPSLTTTSKKRKSNPTQQISVLPPVAIIANNPKTTTSRPMTNATLSGFGHPDWDQSYTISRSSARITKNNTAQLIEDLIPQTNEDPNIVLPASVNDTTDNTVLHNNTHTV